MKPSQLPVHALLAPFLLQGLLHAGMRQDTAEFEALQDRASLQEIAVPSTSPVIFEGRVLTPQGQPAEGAVIVSSAGGKAVSDAQGLFSLAVEISLDAREVQLTAVQAGTTSSHLATAAIPLFHGSGTIPTGTLRLELGAICDPSWLPTFGGEPGVSIAVYALAVFDDGSGDGPALYAGGYLTSAGGVAVNRIARWDGSVWSALGSGMSDWVYALAVYDDGLGGGPALYAGGVFSSAGGAYVSHIARWDGASWSSLGSGRNGAVWTLTVYDDGSGNGPALYAGGGFHRGGGQAHIARWDGSSWSGLGSGVHNGGGLANVYALTVYDDGSGNGPALFVGGEFSTASGLPAANIAKWSGTAWSALGSGMNDAVRSLSAYDDGSGGGRELYAGGEFSSAGGVAANHIAKWDGASWSPVGGGSSGAVRALSVYDDGLGGGPALYAGGQFTNLGGVPFLARWDGSTWSALGSGVDDGVFALTVYDDGSGSGPALCAGGWLKHAGGVAASNVARWDGAAWSPLGGSGLNRGVHAVTVYDDGSGGGHALYAAGTFTTAGGVPANRIARWNGGFWSPLGSGIEGIAHYTSVDALAVYDDGSGSGPALYAGGQFTLAGGVAANNIARWNGTSWSPLDGGTNDTVHALAVYDDGSGSGPELYVGGLFTLAGGVGGVPANRVVRWDGSSWSALGSGVSGGVGYIAVYALTAYDDGTGAPPALYAGGRFTMAGGAAASCIARWDGTSWSPLGSGTNDAVLALTAYDDGTGSGLDLYAGGEFTTAGGVLANRIASWNGTSWSQVGGGVRGNELYPSVNALSVHDDGSGGGPALYAGGKFTLAGGVVANYIARWNGSSWSPIGAGVNGAVLALTGYDDGLGGGQSLYAGGWFGVSPGGDSYIARWGCPGPEGAAYCFGDGSGTPCPCGNTGGPGEGCANSTGSGAVLAATGSDSVAADDLGFIADNLLPNQPALLFAGTNAVNGGSGSSFGDGLRCAGMNVIRLGVEIPDIGGMATWGPGLGAQGGWQSGDTRFFQTWYRNPGGSPCGFGFNLSHGRSIVFVP